MSLDDQPATPVEVSEDGTPVGPLAVQYVPQIMTNWCWAACIEMVFRFNGRQINKCDVVTKELPIRGRPDDPNIQLPCTTLQLASPTSDITCGEDTPCQIYNFWFQGQELPCKLNGPPDLPVSDVIAIIKTQIGTRQQPIHTQDSFHARVVAGYILDSSQQIDQVYILDPDPSKGLGWRNFTDFDWTTMTLFYDFGVPVEDPCSR